MSRRRCDAAARIGGTALPIRRLRSIAAKGRDGTVSAPMTATTAAPLLVDQIRRHAPGRQLDAGLETDIYGRSVYRVRWAGADGRRSDYIVDAETGRILGVDGR